MTSAQDGGLDDVAIRLLGCLVEKERTTPDDYPLTANALMRAANQTTSRDPIVDYGVGLVESTMARLKDAGLIRFVHSPSNRAMKYRQVLDTAWEVSEEQLAILALLMLRGPQTIGELKGRSERLASFADLDEVRSTLEALAARDEPMVMRLERVAGHKEPRWVHLLGDPDAIPTVDAAPSVPDGRPATAAPAPGARDDRMAALEAEVAVLRAAIDELRAELGLPRLAASAASEGPVASAASEAPAPGQSVTADE